MRVSEGGGDKKRNYPPVPTSGAGVDTGTATRAAGAGFSAADCGRTKMRGVTAGLEGAGAAGRGDGLADAGLGVGCCVAEPLLLVPFASGTCFFWALAAPLDDVSP